MKHQNISVSIGIAAYNEEQNIQNLLNDIHEQKQEGWKLKEVIVYCDGSTDRTIQKINQFSKRVVVIDGKDRKGKSFGLSKIFKKSTGDILILFDADVRLESITLITNLLTSFQNKKDVMVVGGNTCPFQPKIFFERAVYVTFLVFNESRKKIKNGNNIFGCTGGCMALRKEFYQSLEIPLGILNDDDYIYFSCLASNKKFLYNESCRVLYKLPTHLRDYLAQTFRSHPLAVTHNLESMFGNIVEKEYKRPISLMIKAILHCLFMWPLETMYIIVVNLLCRPLIGHVASRYKLHWFTAESTKNV